MHAYLPFIEEILIDEAALQARIEALGAQINADYSHAADLLLICVLKGGVLFLTDLMRHIHVPHAIDFMAISSYGAARASRAASCASIWTCAKTSRGATC